MLLCKEIEKQKSITVSMNEIVLPNTEVKLWTRKIEFPQVNFPHFLTQPKITRQRTLKITDIEHDRIEDEISRMGHVE